MAKANKIPAKVSPQVDAGGDLDMLLTDLPRLSQLRRMQPLKLNLPKPPKRGPVSPLAKRTVTPKLDPSMPPKRGTLWVAPDLHVLLRGPQGSRGIPASRIEGQLKFAERALNQNVPVKKAPKSTTGR